MRQLLGGLILITALLLMALVAITTRYSMLVGQRANRVEVLRIDRWTGTVQVWVCRPGNLATPIAGPVYWTDIPPNCSWQ